jgi:sugar lactone lactonase YvrE
MTIQPAGLSITLAACAALLLGAACGSDPEPTPALSAGTAAPAPSVAGATAAGTGAVAGSAGNGSQTGATVVAGAAGAKTPPAGAGSAAAGSPAAGSGGAPAAGTPAPSAVGGAGAAVPPGETVSTIYWLDINGNRVMRSQNFDAGTAIVARTGTAPDGVAVDVPGGKLYWTNMGSLLGTGGGSLQRANLDGTMVETIVMPGVAQTPKQMQVDLVNKHAYWCDREGAKVWRSGLDGSMPTAIVSEHGFRELVGVALDIPAGKFYFTDRIGKKILRTNMELPAGQTGANRMDIEELIVLTGNAMPIDLDIDHDKKMLYWTDRNLGTVHSANLDIPAGQTAMNRSDAKTLVMGLVETIGLSLDVKNNKMYFTELGGQVSEAALDGSGLKRGLLRSSSASGVAIVQVPKK